MLVVSRERGGWKGQGLTHLLELVKFVLLGDVFPVGDNHSRHETGLLDSELIGRCFVLFRALCLSLRQYSPAQ